MERSGMEADPRLTRTPVMRAVVRGAIATTDAPGSTDASRRIIRGVGNSFGVMHSARLIHPAAVEAWLARRQAEKNPDTLPLMAQHGAVQEPFARVGNVLTLAVERSKGLTFTAELATRVKAADDAWALIRQGMHPQISIGWWGKARWVQRSEPELDPWVAQQLDAAGVAEAYVFFTFELAEISLVDIGDDPGARLAARAGGAELAELRAEVKSLRQEVAALKAGGASMPVAELRTLFAEWLGEFKQAACDALAEDETIGDYAGGWAAAREARREEAAASAGGALATARTALERFGQGA